MSALPFVIELIARTALIAAGTAAVLWVLRIRTASVRHAAWAAVVVAMLVLPLLLVARVRLSLPVLTPAAEITSTPLSEISTPPVSSSAPAAPDEVFSAGYQQTSTSPFTPAAGSVDWRVLLLSGYLAGALFLLVRLVVGTVQANRLRQSALVHEGRLTSDRCVTPITVGWLAPVLILPRGWDRWSPEQLTVVLTHEREHARRRDPLTQWLALLNRALFWFHPLAWWLERRLLTLAEEACDAAVLLAGHSPHAYSEYLLDMARIVSRRHGRVRLVGMAMPGAGLPDRLRRILKGLPATHVSRTRLLCTIGFCAISSAIFAAGTLAERAAQPPKPNEAVLAAASASTPLLNVSATQSDAAPAAQPASSQSSRFDVASIKPCEPGSGPAPGQRGPSGVAASPGYLFLNCLTLPALVNMSSGHANEPLNYLLRNRVENGFKPVRGGPSWIDTDRFTIEARSTSVTDRDTLTGPMLRALLEDRFQLRTHQATEDRAIYALKVVAGGLKIKPVAPGSCWELDPENPPQPGQVNGPVCGMFLTRAPFKAAGAKIGKTPAATGTSLSDFLSHIMDRPVLDQTGLDGRYDVVFDYTPDETTPNWRSSFERAGLSPPQPAPSSGPNIFKALDTLGLKLEPTKWPVEYLVVDSAQRPKPNQPDATAVDTPARVQGAGSSMQQPDGSNAAPAPEGRRPSSSMQTSQGMQIKFEAVSIRTCLETGEPGGRGGGTSMRNAITPGYASWGCVTLSQLIDQAYGGGAFPNNSLQNTIRMPPGQRLDTPKRIRGGPSWVENERFAIEIRLSGDTTNLTGSLHHNAVLTAMAPALRALLEDRFQLRLRKVTEEQRMYALTAPGFNLTVSAPEKCWKPEDYPRPPGLSRMELPPPPPGWEGIPACGYQANGGRARGNESMTFTHISLGDLAKWLSRAMDRYVLDKTNKPGRFSFRLEFAPDDNTPGITESNRMFALAGAELMGRTPPAPVQGDGPTIFKALETLGLKLEPTRGPAEYLQIDSAQRPKPNGPASD